MSTTVSIKRLNSSEPRFASDLSECIRRSNETDTEISQQVGSIIAGVRQHGDTALLEYVKSYDPISPDSVASLRISAEQIADCAKSVDPKQQHALEVAAQRIERFAIKQKMDDWSLTEDGVELTQCVMPIESVAIYVPGGKASYPSSVLMNAIPARVAGVERIVAVTPAKNGVLAPLVAKALQLMDIDEVYAMGGAHAVAALAYGSETILPVKKIVGPGNAYVSEAKRQVYGQVGIDMLAGPSEVLVICDGKTDPEWIACDLFAQAEHDEDARAILICTEAEYFAKVEAAMNRLLDKMPRKDIIATALNGQGLFIQTDTLTRAVAIANRIAPEHLELSVEAPNELLPQLTNAGAVFLGSYTSAVIGDYCAGPNHVLPTAGAVYFSSPLGVYDFQKRMNTVHCSPQKAQELGKIAACLAEAEGLFAHSQSAKSRTS